MLGKKSLIQTAYVNCFWKVFSHRPKFPKDPAKVPTFPEFDDMFWKEFKRREESQKQKRKQQVMSSDFYSMHGIIIVLFWISFKDINGRGW